MADPFAWDLLGGVDRKYFFGSIIGGAEATDADKFDGYPDGIDAAALLNHADLYSACHEVYNGGGGAKQRQATNVFFGRLDSCFRSFWWSLPLEESPRTPLIRDWEKKPRERPSPDYLETTQRRRISRLMRARIIGSMVQLSRQYDLDDDTLHSAVSYMDRFLSVKAVPFDEQRLFLLGATAVFVAANYEDRHSVRRLRASDIALHCFYEDTTSTPVISMEREIIAALNYRLGGPTTYTFIRHFTRYYDSDGEPEDLLVQQLAHQLANSSLIYYGFLRYLPSVMAASAIFLARLQLLSPAPPYALLQPWSKDLVIITEYKASELEGCVRDMYGLLAKPSFKLLHEHFLDYFD